MTEIISLVTPLTRGLIWLPKGSVSPDLPAYKAMDYLLDGLLTASLAARGSDSQGVYQGSGFGRPFTTCVGEEALKSFLDLVGAALSGQDEVLVLDESDRSAIVFEALPDSLKGRLKVLRL